MLVLNHFEGVLGSLSLHLFMILIILCLPGVNAWLSASKEDNVSTYKSIFFAYVIVHYKFCFI